MNNNHFNKVGGLNPPRTMFNLNYQKKFTCDMAELIPIMCDEVVPGDFVKVGNQAIVRFQPLVAPILHDVSMTVHYFFVPYRLLWNAETREELTETGDWESFITGGEDGTDASTPPTWNPSTKTVGSLWDYLGFPTGVDAAGCYPLDFPRRAYNLIYNEFFRDQNLITAFQLDDETIKNRCWAKDYFTSALPFQQKGTPPALPISGTTSAVWASSSILASNVTTPATPIFEHNDATSPELYLGTGYANARTNAEDFFNDNTVDLSVASTFDISDLRLAFQIQKWMERNARAGSRYTEYLKAHYGVSPKDERLQRPEYFGGSKTPVIFSEVLQTESSDATTPQGNLAGHGISVSDAYCGKIHITEHGLIMGIMSVMPSADYSQGIQRQWLRSTRYDFYTPEFANLSEQAITNAEVYVTDGNSTTNQAIFGYQGRYNELRSKQNMICGDMRATFDYWHIGRQFSTVPTLNNTFVICTPRKDHMASSSDDAMIIQFQNLITAYRPMPLAPEPGLIDHY